MSIRTKIRRIILSEKKIGRKIGSGNDISVRNIRLEVEKYAGRQGRKAGRKTGNYTSRRTG